MALVALAGCGGSSSTRYTSGGHQVAQSTPTTDTIETTTTVAARHPPPPKRVGEKPRHFEGNGGLTLHPFRLRNPATLRWTNDGPLFQVFDSGSQTYPVLVNSRASAGSTYMGPGAYTLQVNAVGNWTIDVRP